MRIKNISLSILLIFIIISCDVDVEIGNSKDDNVQQILKNVKQQLVPDKRDHIFEIDVTNQDNKFTLSGFSDFPLAVKTLLDSLKTKQVNFENKIQMLPIEKYKNIMGITRLSVANLRSKPKHSAELVTQTLMGMPIVPLQEKNGFIRVKTPENYYAWVDKAGIELVDKSNYEAWLKNEKIIITSNYGQSHQTENQQSEVVSDYVLNDVFSVLKTVNNYYQVLYPDGRKGFISKNNALTLQEFNDKNKLVEGQKVINKAKRLLGTPYLWGGTSSKAVDCSGFTKTVYASFGYNLPRDASQQAKIGKEIKVDKNDFSQLKPGDLLFFGRMKNGKPKITHVAFHIGNGKIIHATGEVKIESLNPNDKDFNQARYDSWLMARRIINHYPKEFSGFYTKQ